MEMLSTGPRVQPARIINARKQLATPLMHRQLRTLNHRLRVATRSTTKASAIDKLRLCHALFSIELSVLISTHASDVW